MLQSSVSALMSSNSAPLTCDCLAHRFGNAGDRPYRRPRYPSDMSDAEWAVVRDAMPVPGWLEGHGGQPESYCHRQMVDAVRYLVAGGITWRAMPADFPSWDRVYAFFRRWRDKGLVTEFHDRLRGRVREAAGRDPEPTAGVIDAQSVKAAASVPAATRGRREEGERPQAPHRGGHPRAAADGDGYRGLGHRPGRGADPAGPAERAALARHAGVGRRRLHRAPGRLRPRCPARRADGGQRSDDTSGFTVLPKRWLVERTFAWLMHSRRLARDYETRTDSSEAVIRWSMSMVMSRRLVRRAR